MTLVETLKTMKEKNSEQNFNIMVEGMRRRADKGMIPGVSSKDIDNCLREMEEAEMRPQSLNEKEEIISLIADLDNAINKYGYLAEDYEVSDDEMNTIALSEFYLKLSEVFNEDIAGFKTKRRDWAEENPMEHGRAMAGAGAVGGIAAGGFVGANYARRAAERAAYIKNYASTGKTAAELAKEYSTANPGLLKKAGSGIVKAGKALGSFAKANPLAAGIIGGVTAGAVGGLGLLAAIRRARRKRQSALREGLETFYIFNEDVLKEANEITKDFPLDLLEAIFNESNELIQYLINDVYLYNSNNTSNSLNEAVTYINNNGELKTKSAKEYVEDMHKYNLSTEMEKLDLKKRKTRKYSLLDENLENIKPLSEMTLEEILAEADNY